MGRLRWGLVVVVVGGACVYVGALHPRERVPDHPYFDVSTEPWVVAHRGGAALAPENTMEALRWALAMGVDALEMDLRVSADGVFVLMHDAAVERTTNRTGRVGEMSVAELQALDAGFRFADDSGNSPFRDAGLTVPRLEEVLRHLPEARINLEMKEFTPEQARGLCTVLRRHHSLEQVLVSAFDHAPMVAFREACPEVATGATRREVIAFYSLNRLGLGRLFRSPAVTLQVPFRFRGRAMVTPWLLETSRRSNRRVQVWTVNDETEMERLLELGVQAILTDRPDRLLALLGRRPPRGRCGRSAGGAGPRRSRPSGQRRTLPRGSGAGRRHPAG